MRRVIGFILMIMVVMLTFVSSNFESSGNVVDGDVYITKADASLAIESAEDVISRISEDGFSILYVSDQLFEAKRIMNQLYYVEIIKSSNSSYLEKAEASDALRLVNYREILYSDVLVYTDEINRVKGEIFEISDRLYLLNFQIDNFADDGLNVSEVRASYNDAVKAFDEERYVEAYDKVDVVYQLLEEKAEERANSAIVLRGVKEFILEYWQYILGILIVFFFVFYVINRKVRIYLIEKKIKYLQAEKKALEHLVVGTQKDRFKKKIISSLVYKIRYEKYMNKIDQVNHELPIWLLRLSKIKDKVNVKSKRKKK